jgi:glycosyltransferase involved in cell wall biosynthesis
MKDAIHFPYSICIPRGIGRGGGCETFWNYFEKYLSKNSIYYHRDIFKKSDFLMLNSWQGSYYSYKLCNILYPKRIKVQRIDGSAKEYGRGGYWDEKQKRINKIVDLVIYQSEFSRYVTSEKHAIIDGTGCVIYNPVDTDLFSPHGETLSLSGATRIAFCSNSANPKKGFHEVVAVAKNNPDLSFFVAGNMPESELPENIVLLGYLSKTELSKMLRSCHFFIFFSENESCPNIVLEAMASGLPVIYKDSGGTVEIVGDAGINASVETFRQALETLWENYKEFKMKAQIRAKREFSVNKIIHSYLGKMRTFVEV